MNQDAYYTLNLSTLKSLYNEWSKTLPTIKPYYAIKCNPNIDIITLLADMGSNFDCASPSEIDLVLGLGVSPNRILYANPCKRIEDIIYAKQRNIKITTFDSVCELKKIATVYPEMQLILRIRADDPSARCNLGVKYGSEECDWDFLLLTANILNLNVVGVSFHVGSYASCSEVFYDAIEKAQRAIDICRGHGFKPHIIDIGGGFSSAHGLPKNIKPIEGITMIAEPGRFFVESIMTLYTPIIGVKGDGITISESIYGAFNCIIFDHYTPKVKMVIDKFNNEIKGDTKEFMIFGSTCDGGDLISKQYSLPIETDYGHWIVWENFGAYTTAACTNFNGIPFNNREIISVKCI
jgi:ornithine decarboxylase